LPDYLFLFLVAIILGVRNHWR